MPPLPFAEITYATLIVHGTRDAMAEFYANSRELHQTGAFALLA